MRFVGYLYTGLDVTINGVIRVLLAKYKDYANEIGVKAEKCPFCGATRKTKNSAYKWLVLILIIFGVYVFINSFSNTVSGFSSNKISVVQELDTSSEKQEKRKAFIVKLIGQGILYKVEVPGVFPRIYVLSDFYALNFADKQSFISVVYAYYLAQDSRANVVTLYDSKTGKQIGMFTERGLDLD
jgi:TM2 domain-containing membrane protein YozV